MCAESPPQLCAGYGLQDVKRAVVHHEVLRHWRALIHYRAVQNDANKDEAVSPAVAEGFDTDGIAIVFVLRSHRNHRNRAPANHRNRAPARPWNLRTPAYGWKQRQAG
jgi:hypothetical protein